MIRWPEFSEEKLRKLASKDPPSGASAVYVKWTKKVGLKIFFSRRHCNAAHKLQKRAAEAGLAPAAGPKVSFKIFTIVDATQDNWADYCCKLQFTTVYGYFTQHVGGIGKKRADRKIKALAKGLLDVGIEHTDLHEWNVGTIDKKPVCIDFDPISCREHKIK